jgi:hypothetical protein
LQIRQRWLDQSPVAEISTAFFPSPRHKFNPPLIYYGIPLPEAELCDYVDTRQLQQLASGEMRCFLALEDRGIDEELACPSDDGKPKTKRSLSAKRIFTHEHALRCIERDMGLPENILEITSGLTSQGRADLSFYNNYHGKDALTPEQVNKILDSLGIKDQPLWYLGGTGSWTERVVKPVKSSRIHSSH